MGPGPSRPSTCSSTSPVRCSHIRQPRPGGRGGRWRSLRPMRHGGPVAHGPLGGGLYQGGPPLGGGRTTGVAR
eukprot:12054949-Alexandrium_andersonii.AAC.1